MEVVILMSPLSQARKPDLDLDLAIKLAILTKPECCTARESGGLNSTEALQNLESLERRFASERQEPAESCMK